MEMRVGKTYWNYVINENHSENRNNIGRGDRAILLAMESVHSGRRFGLFYYPKTGRAIRQWLTSDYRKFVKVGSSLVTGTELEVGSFYEVVRKHSGRTNSPSVDSVIYVTSKYVTRTGDCVIGYKNCKPGTPLSDALASVFTKFDVVKKLPKRKIHYIGANPYHSFCGKDIEYFTEDTTLVSCLSCIMKLP